MQSEIGNEADEITNFFPSSSERSDCEQRDSLLLSRLSPFVRRLGPELLGKLATPKTRRKTVPFPSCARPCACSCVCMLVSHAAAAFPGAFCISLSPLLSFSLKTGCTA